MASKRLVEESVTVHRLRIWVRSGQRILPAVDGPAASWTDLQIQRGECRPGHHMHRTRCGSKGRSPSRTRVSVQRDRTSRRTVGESPLAPPRFYGMSTIEIRRPGCMRGVSCAPNRWTCLPCIVQIESHPFRISGYHRVGMASHHMTRCEWIATMRV